MYQLYHGDCLDVLPTLAAGSVDAVICDPPYGTTACKWDSVIPFEPMWRELKRLIKPRGAIVLFGSQPFTSALVMSNPRWFRYEWVWDKGKPTGYQMANYRPMKKHESITVFSGSPATATPLHMTYNPQGIKRCNRTITRTHKFNATDDGGSLRDQYIGTVTGFPSSILDRYNDDRDRLHPTQKPLELMEYLIRTYTNEGDTVLDFTMGSGSTGHACANTGRRFIGIERDAAYFATAEARIAAAYAPLAHMERAS